MSRNASGTYTLPSGNPVVTGTLIESSWANTTLSDLASAMTDSLSRSAQGGMTAALRLYDGTSSVPGLAWGSETTTGWYRSGAGDMRLVVTGSEVVKYLSTGVSVTGTLSSTGNFAVNTDKFTVAASSGNTAVAGTLAVTGAATFSGTTMTLENSTAYYPQVINRNKTADANGSYISLQKIRGSSIVQNGDVLGNLIFSGYDGAAYLQGAYINAVVSATPGTNDMPADLAFGTTPDGGAGPTERLRITQAGNVGIGTSSPTAKLDVATSINLSGQNYLNAAYDLGGGAGWLGGYNITYSSSAVRNVTTGALSGIVYGGSGLQFYTNSSAAGGTAASERMRITSAGDVGIGTSSPASKLEVAGQIFSSTSTTSGNVGLVGRAAGSNTFIVGSETAINGGTDQGLSLFSYGATNLRMYTNGAERARIDSSGNLFVNATAQSGDAPNNTGIQVLPVGDIKIRVASNSQPALQFYSPGGGTGSAVGSVTAGASSTAYNTSSDYRLKENIAPMTGALSKVAALKPVTYTWKSTGEADEGFIAHELAEVVPQCVTGEKDAVETYTDEEGNEQTRPVYQGIDTSFLVATLTAAIQELKAEFDAYKASHP